MEELVKMVAQKTGIPAAQAKQAVDTVLGFLKERLPAPIASQLDSAISGGGGVSGLAKGLGGMMGGSK
jgi:hypothetical protein